jgi:hypothetical protein
MTRKKVGRKSRYESHIKPYLDYIDKALNDGASEKQVAENLNIAYSTWNKYKLEYQELYDLCAKPRAKLIDNLRSVLVKKAMGFTYEEKKIYKKRDNEGKEHTYEEITIKQALPDTTAIFGALNLYDPDYVRDKKAYELKKEELEIKKENANKDNW